MLLITTIYYVLQNKLSKSVIAVNHTIETSFFTVLDKCSEGTVHFEKQKKII